MDKVAIRVTGDPSFFDEIAREAARLDRSQSWLLGYCLRAALPSLASERSKPAAGTATRHPVARVYFVPKDLRADAEKVGGRFGMAESDVLAWAWDRTRETIRSLPTS